MKSSEVSQVGTLSDSAGNYLFSVLSQIKELPRAAYDVYITKIRAIPICLWNSRPALFYETKRDTLTNGNYPRNCVWPQIKNRLKYNDF